MNAIMNDNFAIITTIIMIIIKNALMVTNKHLLDTSKLKIMMKVLNYKLGKLNAKIIMIRRIVIIMKNSRNMFIINE